MVLNTGEVVVGGDGDGTTYRCEVGDMKRDTAVTDGLKSWLDASRGHGDVPDITRR